jgi:hypothetical protein
VLVGIGVGEGVGVKVAVAWAMAGKVAVDVGRATGRFMRPTITTPPMANNPITSKPTKNSEINTKSLLSPVMTLLLSLVTNDQRPMTDYA